MLQILLQSSSQTHPMVQFLGFIIAVVLVSVFMGRKDKKESSEKNDEKNKMK